MKDKKGIFGSGFIFGLFGLFILIMILTVLLPVQKQVVEADQMVLVLKNVSSNLLNNNFQIRENNTVTTNVLYSFLRFILYSSFEVVKAAVNYVIENPSFVNANTLLIIIMISLFIPIIYYTFMFCVILFLLIREWYLTKKEKKKYESKN